jgi:hypothetical protein
VLRPDAKRLPRSTVANPSATVTLRTRVPRGTYVRSPRLISARVKPDTSWCSASSGEPPGRITCTSCSPCRKKTGTLFLLDVAEAVGAAMSAPTSTSARAA